MAGDTLACEVLKPCEEGTNLKESKEILGDLLNSREKVPHHGSLYTGAESVHPALSPGSVAASWSNKDSKRTSRSDLAFELVATTNDLLDLSLLSESSDSLLNGLNRAAHATFMAVELLEYPTVKHLHRHDLESVIWVLVWLCRKDPDWYNTPRRLVANSKAAYTWATACRIPEGIEKEYEALWPPVANVVCDWMGTYIRAVVRDRLNTLSDDKVLAAIREEFPCPDVYEDWDWARFAVQ